MRKLDFCICENKDADQLRGNREADQRICFRYTDSTIRLLPKSEISSLSPSSVTAQPGLCGTWSETPKTGFPRTRLILSISTEILYQLAFCCNKFHMKTLSFPRLFQIITEPRHEKTNILVSDLVRHKPGCTATEDG